ncbi:hypothetical protein VP1G_08702 [Cytospora mali]|uniref:Uncharacterized protein n=1 Tax=Cytospora mali TaxID=578113 RepID=A0A194VCA3_CYTMA|nr:hypothetical protein VP1G_08702 [Valsa mali var. pyri (nom. inval.)]
MPRSTRARAASHRTRATTGRATAGKATAGSPLLPPLEDPEAILRQRRRKVRAAEIPDEVPNIAPVSPVRESSDQQANSIQGGGPEVPSISDSDPWAAYESITRPYSQASGSAEAHTDLLSILTEHTLTALYKRIGYMSPIAESTKKIVHQIMADPSIMSLRTSPYDTPRFRVGLNDRNVAFEPCHDSFLDFIKSLSTNTSDETPLEKTRHTLAWNLDLQKTRSDPKEPVFQRTVLMSMIDRHRFIYDQGDNKTPLLDFAVERTWKCRPMPSMVFKDPEPRCLTQPKADLAIAFRQFAVFQRKHWQLLPAELREMVCYEGEATGKEGRVFHFLMIESKNTYKTLDDEVGLCQSLNNASQSLHNLYEFFREAGDEYVQIFFDRVRVFSATSTSQGIKIRAHRACLVEDARPDTAEHIEADDVPAMSSIVDDYPLQFVYDDFFEASGSDFTREKVVSIFEKLMVGYGIRELWGHLQNAARAIEEKCIAYNDEHKLRLWRTKGYYTHGLILPDKHGATTTSAVSGVSNATKTTIRATGGRTLDIGSMTLGNRPQGSTHNSARKRRRA